MVQIKKWFYRTDVWVFAVLLLAALLFWLVPHLAAGSGSRATAGIYVDKQLVQTVELDPDQTGTQSYTVKGAIGDVIVEIKAGQIRVADAPCKDKICVHTGWIENQGEVIVCIPSHLLIQIENGAPSEEETDTVVY